MSVHNLSREAMRPGDVYVGRRPSPRWARLIPAGCNGADGTFGNPHIIDGATTREQAVEAFERSARRRIAEDPEYRDRVRALHGKRLFCWCSSPGDGVACHAKVLECLADELVGAEGMDSEGAA